MDEYHAQAQALHDARHSGDNAAAWRFKWEHPRFRGKGVDDVRAATLSFADAQQVVASEHAFEDWAHLTEFDRAMQSDSRVARFERAVEAVIDGDVAALRAMLAEDPELIRERSMRRHHATLLHYVAANGVEGARQRTPPNAVEVARLLLDAGTDADALADMYDHKCSTMSMLVSSAHPAKAGVQLALAETLLDHGAALVGPGTNWQSAVLTALAFGYLDTARGLAARGMQIDNLPAAAGLGDLDAAKRLLPAADAHQRHVALALAAQHGHAPVVTLLLDAGEDPSRYNPEGYHSHSTPLHQAVWANHMDVVRVLVGRGARLDLPDKVYSATPLGWAEYGERDAMADYLRSVDASD